MTQFNFDMPGVTLDQPGVFFDLEAPVPTGEVTMARVKLGLAEKSEDEKLDLAQTIVTSMTGNANYPSPAPTLAVVSAARTDALNKKLAYEAALATADLKKSEKDAAFAYLDTVLTQEAAHVQSVSGGDKVKIESAGMDTRAAATPVGLLPAPTDLLVTDGGTEGRLNLRWKAVRRATSYKIQSCSGNTPMNWDDLDTTTRAAFAVNGLTSGTKYWFRVAAVSSAGTGGWSDPACKVAP